MGAYVGRRSLYSLISLLGLVVLVFFLARLTGDPTDLYLPIDASLEAREEFREKHGFDDPLVEQFGRFLSDLVRFDLGTSIRTDRPALEMVLEALPVSLTLAALAMASAVGLAILIGSVAVLLVRPMGLLVQVVRGAMVTALHAPYVKTAQSRGIRKRRIVFAHALRNSMLPVVTVASDQAAGIINGAVIVETVFGLPGVGKLMTDAIVQRDFAVIQAAILVTAALIFLMNILVDVAYAVLDPRVRDD
ncbi:MAG: ABC transporter permease [Pseudomonadota bacterium]